MTTSTTTRRRLAGQRERFLTQGENLAAGAKAWTQFPGGAFRRAGPWFVDITRGSWSRRFNPWRVTITPALKADRPARVGGDTWRHDPDPAHATNLGEFFTYALAVRAGDRWVKAQETRNPQGPWVGRADW